MKFIGHIPDVLAKLADGLMLKWRTTQVIDKSNGKHRDATWETRLSGSGILIPWIFSEYLVWGKDSQKMYENIKQLKRHETFKKNTSTCFN